MRHFLSLPVMAASALALAACSAPEDSASTGAEDTAAPDVKLYAFDCGRIDLLDLSIFAQDDEFASRQHSAAIMCYLIRHPDGDLMWDAGIPDALSEQEDGVTNGPFHLTVPTTLASQLAGVGVSPDDIEYFSASHSHFDHVGNASMFAASTFLVDADERAFMFRDEARADQETFPLVAPLETAETIEFDGDHDVFGDGSVKIIAAPGHTPGHTVLLVNLPNTGKVLLSGDLYHLLESRERRTVPKFNTSVEDTLASMDMFEALAEETGARVIIQHSMEDFDALPKSPAYLD